MDLIDMGYEDYKKRNMREKKYYEDKKYEVIYKNGRY